MVFSNDADAGWDVYFTPNKARVISSSVVRVLSLFLSNPVSASLSRFCCCLFVHQGIIVITYVIWGFSYEGFP